MECVVQGIIETQVSFCLPGAMTKPLPISFLFFNNHEGMLLAKFLLLTLSNELGTVYWQWKIDNSLCRLKITILCGRIVYTFVSEL